LEKARDLGWNVSVVPDRENAEGLLDALGGNDMEGQTVWIPSGNRAGSAREVLPRTLESRGAKVESFQVYVTENRRLTKEELRELDRAEPGALVLHSPSGAEAVFDDQAPAAVRRWHQAAVVSAGPATADRSRELGAREIVECKTPSDSGILAALGELNDLRTEGTLP
jgi:uroporphyrinogen III methyltransferase/synthase